MTGPAIRAALFDFGGVLTTSPFQAFARYEAAAGLPDGFLRRLNATNADTNAWARLERAEIGVDEFARAYAAEARAAGGVVDPHAVLAALRGDLVPEMVEAVRRLRDAGMGLGLLTNNYLNGGSAAGGGGVGGGWGGSPPVPPGLGGGSAAGGGGVGGVGVGGGWGLGDVLDLFDAVVESAVEGVRKPEPRAYVLACERLGVTPDQVVFLDDLGVNLKPARAMGMATIKVVDHVVAIAELADVVGLDLR